MKGKDLERRATKAVGPRFGKTVNPKRAKFGKKTPSTLLTRRRRR